MPNRNIGLVLKLGAAAGLIVFLLSNVVPLFSPEAGQTPQVTRAEAEAAAERFVRERLGMDEEEGLRAFAVYIADREAVGYLYRIGAAESGDERLGTVFPLDMYRVEIVDKAGAVHYIDINPYTGEAAEWELFAKGEGSAGIPAPEAGEAAERAARETLSALGWTEARITPASSGGEDGAMVFEARDPAFGDAFVRLQLKTAGGLGVTSLAADWNVPESYSTLVERQDARSALFGGIGLALSAALQFAALIYALSRMREIRWGRGAVMALVFGLFYCAVNLNMYPGMKASLLGWLDGGSSGEAAAMDSVETAAGLVIALLFTNALTIALAIGMYFSAVAGDRLAGRGTQPLWPFPADPGYSGSVVSGMAKGYLFAPLLLGVQSLLLLAADSLFGSWYTIDALSSPNNMAYPLLMPLLAWCAALEEEAVFRLFAIPALAALFTWIAGKFGWKREGEAKEGMPYPAAAVALAVAVSSMIWALGHVQYPIYPYYTRFAEVTALGFLFAYIFMRHGLFTAIFTHAVIDLIWMGMSIVASDPSPANFAAFICYLATPALVAGFIRLRRREPPASAIG